MEYKPDWSPDTIAEIEKILNEDYTIFEWGTGYSTIWLAERVGQVITMEHTQKWYDKIKAIAKELHLFNIDFNLYPLTDERYFKHIHNTAGADFIIIDGRERVRCFGEAIKLGKPIMLDDSERERYKAIFDMADYKSVLHTISNNQGQKATIFIQ